MDQQYQPEDQSDELPYWPIYGRDLVFELTVSEVVMSLAARIPSELFENILFYVNVDRITQRREGWQTKGSYLTRNRGRPSPNDILIDLKQCSLVCLFWANRCREHIFAGTTLEIKSHEDAEIFRRYVVGGCSRLAQVHQLIECIDVHQDYSGIWAPQTPERLTSFLHLLYLPVIRDKFAFLSIDGPVPDGFNPAKLDTPHWGIPPSVSVPSSFLQDFIYLGDVHFPSFYHIIKYIRHFSCATYVFFESVTWDGQMGLSLPHTSSTIACQRRPRRMSIEVKGSCTDSVHLALTALMLNPNCPLHRISDEEHVWMIKFITLLWGDPRALRADIQFEFDVSEQEQLTTMCLTPFHFVFEEASASADRSAASSLSVVGMHTYTYQSDDLSAHFDALVNHASTQPTIRAFVLLFRSLDSLQKSVKPFVEVLALAAETIEILLVYEEKKERKAVGHGVDPVTLEPDGRIWTDLPVPIQNTYNENVLKSLHILQTQLKKKIRGSVH